MLFLYCRNGVSRDLVVAACVKANSWPEGLYIVYAQLVLAYTHLPEAFGRDEVSSYSKTPLLLIRLSQATGQR